MNGLAPLYAHRGYHGKPGIPENSMAAFRRAIEYELPTEIDVHLIADGTLVVFHDDTLLRMTGERGFICDYDMSNLGRLKLAESDERIPTFNEVLDIYENSGLPLLIELKVDRKNHKELSRAVAERLRSYRGEYAVQSFYPRAILEYKRLMPQDPVGQLSKNYFDKNDGRIRIQAAKAGNLLYNIIVRPDFVAFKFRDRKNKALQRSIERKGAVKLAWTIRTPLAYREAVDAGCIPIFEGIEPDELEKLGVLSKAGMLPGDL